MCLSQQQQQLPPFRRLPPELRLAVLTRLRPEDLLSFVASCREHQALAEPVLYRGYFRGGGFTRVFRRLAPHSSSWWRDDPVDPAEGGQAAVGTLTRFRRYVAGPVSDPRNYEPVGADHGYWAVCLLRRGDGEEALQADQPLGHALEPLCIAAWAGSVELVRYLLAGGAPVDVAGLPAPLSYITPIYLATCAGRPAVIDVLLSAGASLGVHDWKAALLGGQTAAVEVMLRHRPGLATQGLTVRGLRGGLRPMAYLFAHSAASPPSGLVLALVRAGAACDVRGPADGSGPVGDVDDDDDDDNNNNNNNNDDDDDDDDDNDTGGMMRGVLHSAIACGWAGMALTLAATCATSADLDEVCESPDLLDRNLMLRCVREAVARGVPVCGPLGRMHYHPYYGSARPHGPSFLRYCTLSLFGASDRLLGVGSMVARDLGAGEWAFGAPAPVVRLRRVLARLVRPPGSSWWLPGSDGDGDGDGDGGPSFEDEIVLRRAVRAARRCEAEGRHSDAWGLLLRWAFGRGGGGVGDGQAFDVAPAQRPLEGAFPDWQDPGGRLRLRAEPAWYQRAGVPASPAPGMDACVFAYAGPGGVGGRRPPLNHMDRTHRLQRMQGVFGPLEHLESHPVVLSVLAPRRSRSWDHSLAQMGRWHAAQFAALDAALAPGGPPGPGVLLGLVVQQHQWSVVATVREAGRLVVTEGEPVGSTEDLPGASRALHALKAIRAWVSEDSWPAGPACDQVT